MKKYAIIIGENNKETSRKVLKALFAVGFKWYQGKPDSEILTIHVNSHGYKKLSYCHHRHNTIIGVDIGTQYLNPSYVIEHAAELDGAREPWEVAPEGYRLVTEEEREKFKKPSCAKLACKNSGTIWFPVDSTTPWLDSRTYAVPLDFAFKKPWEVAPEGYRLVTEEERKAYCAPTFKYLMGFSSGEWTHRNSLAWADGSISKSLAVPLDFTFAPKAEEMTMEQVCKELGRTVKITK